jgi:hypothetical protein
VAKAFDTVWIDGRLYKLTVLNFVLHSPYNLIVRPGSDVRSVLPDGQVISSSHAGWGASGWNDYSCPLQSTKSGHFNRLINESIKLELQSNNLNRAIHGSHSYNVLKGSAAHRRIRQQLPYLNSFFLSFCKFTPLPHSDHLINCSPFSFQTPCISY